MAQKASIARPWINSRVRAAISEYFAYVARTGFLTMQAATLFRNKPHSCSGAPNVAPGRERSDLAPHFRLLHHVT
jgi:hypothetical protein